MSGGGYAIIPSSGGGSSGILKATPERFEDMVYQPVSLTTVGMSAGSGNLGVTTNALGEYGVLVYQTNAGVGSASGHSAIFSTTAALKYPFIFAFEVVWKVRTLALSTAIDEYKVLAGLNNTTISLGTNSICWYYDRATDGDFWTCLTRSGGVQTKTVTAIPVTANTQYYLKLASDGAGQITFSIASGALGAYVVGATHSTNVPVSVSEMIYILKTVGAGGSTLYCDYYYEKPTIARQ